MYNKGKEMVRLGKTCLKSEFQEGNNHSKELSKNIPGRESSMCRGPEAEERAGGGMGRLKN